MTIGDPSQAASSEAAGEGSGTSVIRWLGGVIANVSVLTALLVYFGWQRNYVMATRVGIQESVLGQSTRDYLLRSVKPTLVLVLVIAIGGLLWLRLDRFLAPRFESRGMADASVRRILRLLSVAWFALPLAVYLSGLLAQFTSFTTGREFAFVTWPLSIGAGALLTYYGIHLRGSMPSTREPMLRAFVTIAVVVMLFWGTSNYATLQGNELADRLTRNLRDQSAVTVYSPKRLFLSGPGVTEVELTGRNIAYTYRYTGLRLLAHAGGRYFLVSDQWAPRRGVVMVLSEKEAVRLEFSHD